MRNWIIVITVFCLWISTMFKSEVQTFLAYFLILTFGVLHGANDLSLIRFKTDNDGVKFSYSRVLSYYVLTVVAILIVFFSYPPLALFMFVLLSAYHFGEQHLKKMVTGASIIKSAAYLFYGLFILFMIFYFNINKVKIIFDDLTGMVFSTSFFRNTLILAGIGLLGSLAYLRLKNKLRINIFEEFFYLLVLLLVFNTADLLWGFCIYFILWHSLPSIIDQMEFLYGKASKITFIKYLKSSWMYWTVSIVGLLILYYFFRNNTESLISILIYFLAAITFPHVIVMSRLEED